jgi:hypothetical protein
MALKRMPLMVCWSTLASSDLMDSPIHCFGARQDSAAAPLVGLDRAR